MNSCEKWTSAKEQWADMRDSSKPPSFSGSRCSSSGSLGPNKTIRKGFAKKIDAELEGLTVAEVAFAAQMAALARKQNQARDQDAIKNLFCDAGRFFIKRDQFVHPDDCNHNGERMTTGVPQVDGRLRLRRGHTVCNRLDVHAREEFSQAMGVTTSSIGIAKF